MVSSLQEKGCIKSVVSKTDARHKVVTFTAKGNKLQQKIEPVWTALQQAMLQLANESPQSKQVLEALTAMENNLANNSLLNRVEKILP
jgi:DNA-binding MarR family transcriptional regulator